MKSKKAKRYLRKIELARELNVSPALVTAWLRRGLIQARADGRLDREAVFRALYWYWVPQYNWWERPVGQMGRRLRQAWAAEAKASGWSL